MQIEPLEQRWLPAGDFTNINAILANVGYGSVIWGDYNSDGHLDLAVSGYGINRRGNTRLYQGDGAGGFTLDSNAILPDVQYSSFAWGDYNNDGHLDLVISGYETGDTTSGKITQVYAGDGAGGFALVNSAKLTAVVGSVAWGDYNNDGHLDLAISGETDDTPPITQVYSGDGTGEFTLDSSANLTGVLGDAITWVDFNNDGHLDLSVSGQRGQKYIDEIYKGDGAGGFTLVTDAVPSGISGFLAWGDYNSDGNPDFVMSGVDSTMTQIAQVYTGDGAGGFTLDAKANLTAVLGGTLTWGDFNNDGHLDLFMGGLDNNGDPIAQLYSGDGSGGFTLDANASLSGTYLGSVGWGDYDNDGRLDLVLSGYDVNLGDTQKTQVYQNTSGAPANAAPTAPTNLSTSFPSSTSVTFSWNAAADGQTASAGLAYALRVGTTPGDADIVNPMSNLITGQRTISSFGMIQGTSYTVTGLIPGATYYWSVQAVDGGMEGGAFATEQSFTLSEQGNQAPAITSTNKTTFIVGSASSFTVTATGTPKPTLAESGAVPSGVTFDAVTGKLSGTPAPGTGGSYTLTFTASNGVGTDAAQTFTFIVNQSPAFSSVNKTTFAVGTAGSYTVTATGTPKPTLAESGALPSGVTFNAATGVLSGTPAAGTNGIYTLTFTASNGVGSKATQSFTLTVNQANQSPAITSANKTTFLAGSLGSFRVTVTGTPTPTLAELGPLPAGVSFNATTGLLTGTPASGTGGSYALSFTAGNGVGADAVQNFTLLINQSPSFTSASKATFAVGQAGSFQITVSGFPTAGLNEIGAMPSGVAFDTATGLLTGTPATGTGGSYPLTFTASNGVGANATQSFILTINQGPLFTSANSGTFIVGSAGSLVVTTLGIPSPFLKETGALPSGVAFNAATGQLSGTPAPGSGGIYPVTFTASNGVGADVTQNFMLTVDQAPAFTIAAVASFAEGKLGAFTLMAPGDPVPAFSVSGALPGGITFDAATGLLSGAPAAGTGGTYAPALSTWRPLPYL